MEGVITKLTDASVYTVGKHEFSPHLSLLQRGIGYCLAAKQKQAFNCLSVHFSFSKFLMMAMKEL